MAIELVTGYQGAVHVTAAQDADLYRGMIGQTGILNVGSNMAAGIVTANQITIADGVCVIDGRECFIGYGETVNVAIESGTQGYYRHDLVMLQYTKDTDTGVESAEFVVIQGTQAESDPADPSYTDTDIRTGVYTSQKPFARIVIDGVSIDSVEILMDVLPSIADLNDATFHNNYSGAGIHNSLYRGKYLGTEVTDDQWAAIKAGTFDDLYIGDYWTINGVNWRIAAFDYYYNCGDTNCTTHHIVIVPDTSLYSATMNSSNITTGGYVGSVMYTTNLADAKTTINSAFGSGHILSHRIYLTNAVTNGYPSAGAWCDSTVKLMNEEMVYGASIFRPHTAYNGSSVTIPTQHTVEKSQLPLFSFRHDLIGIRVTYWLRDVVSAASFATVSGNGYVNSTNASNSYGVRPAFCIYSS